jgi:hypothetical protein
MTVAAGGTRRSVTGLLAVTLAVAVVAVVGWRVIATHRATNTDVPFETLGSCPAAAYVPAPRVAARINPGTVCGSVPANSPLLNMAIPPGEVVVTFVLSSTVNGAPPGVQAVVVDPVARQVTADSQPQINAPDQSTSGAAARTLFFVAVRADQLPTTPFTLVDFDGPVRIAAISG